MPHVKHALRKWIRLLASIVALEAAPALAQDGTSPTPATSPCEIISEKDEGGVVLMASCGRSAVMLGSTTSYEVAPNPATGALVVVTKRGTEIQVLIVRPDGESDAFLENITGDLARRSGRAPEMGLAGLEVDISRFNAEGVIQIASAATNSKTEGRAHQVEISLAAMMADEAMRRTSPHEKPNVVEVASEGQGARVR